MKLLIETLPFFAAVFFCFAVLFLMLSFNFGFIFLLISVLIFAVAYLIENKKQNKY